MRLGAVPLRPAVTPIASAVVRVGALGVPPQIHEMVGVPVIVPMARLGDLRPRTRLLGFATMRDIEVIDRELRLLAAVRRVCIAAVVKGTHSRR